MFALSSYYMGLSGRAYDAAPDGQTFLMIKLPPPRQQFEGLVVVSHWFDELKARVPNQVMALATGIARGTRSSIAK